MLSFIPVSCKYGTPVPIFTGKKGGGHCKNTPPPPWHLHDISSCLAYHGSLEDLLMISSSTISGRVPTWTKEDKQALRKRARYFEVKGSNLYYVGGPSKLNTSKA